MSDRETLERMNALWSASFAADHRDAEILSVMTDLTPAADAAARRLVLGRLGYLPGADTLRVQRYMLRSRGPDTWKEPKGTPFSVDPSVVRIGWGAASDLTRISESYIHVEGEPRAYLLPAAQARM